MSVSAITNVDLKECRANGLFIPNESEMESEFFSGTGIRNVSLAMNRVLDKLLPFHKKSYNFKIPFLTTVPLLGNVN